jgi:aminopeptidase N
MLGTGTNDRTMPHEVAHQWFYSLVGNNQGRDPWLDEGLATWAEARTMDDLGRITGRAVPPAVAGHLGEPMSYWDQHLGDYYEGAYVQGAQALAALGDPDAVDCALRQYVARNAHGVATPADLLDALTPVFPDARATLERFGATF